MTRHHIAKGAPLSDGEHVATSLICVIRDVCIDGRHGDVGHLDVVADLGFLQEKNTLHPNTVDSTFSLHADEALLHLYDTANVPTIPTTYDLDMVTKSQFRHNSKCLLKKAPLE
jgi:hypothetical protein